MTRGQAEVRRKRSSHRDRLRVNALMKAVASTLLAPLALAVSACVPLSMAAQHGTPAPRTEAPFQVSSSAGELEVLKLGTAFTPTFQLKWNGKSLITFDNDRTVTLLRRSGKDGVLLLLEFASQGEDCPTHYRIVDLSVQPQPFVSADLGDCSLPRKIDSDPNGFHITFRGWRYPQRTVAPATWTYASPLTGSAGKLSKVPAARSGQTAHPSLH